MVQRSTPQPKLRLKSALQASVMGIAGLLILRVFHRPALGGILIAIAVVVGVAAQVSPPILSLHDRVGRALVHGTGVALNWVVFTLLYFVVFVPARLYLRLTGRDPMRRAFPAPEPTCWLPSDASTDYGRQY